MKKERFRLVTTSKQRIAIIAALRYYHSQGCPPVASLKGTHQILASDVSEAIDLVESAPSGPITVLVNNHGQFVASESPSDIQAYIFDLDLRTHPIPSKELLDAAALQSVRVMRAGRVVQRLASRLIEEKLNPRNRIRRFKEQT